VRLARGDVRNPGSLALAVQHTDIVYHVAGIAAAFHPAELVEVNTTGFHNVVTVCAACTTPPTLVFVSSLAAAGPSPPTGRGSRAIRRRPSRTTADPSVTPN
jgi:nucleoside-diphosphate-sugar epimerase